ncbi:C4-dicarboxylate ABC transporter substrate-binding protein [Methylobacterium sp. Leaf104]|uniref:TAXI family TRAP transporter solute-binding subunit n=1 Tax=Methylobacterium TaxID=407 RepID=UPI000701B1D9|nr:MULTISPECIES: TAXI family TRAP transporter solute-binding subunit [Methylobacterium]KQP37264.1 C4-dicarboxylate ABC transporter substrate-binding protein [Methylobacterium sp. Leaf104]MCI9882698.1 C4-dicarboxylate ABC transporter substrate-binding protein [Methylobacterium goesingense]
MKFARLLLRPELVFLLLTVLLGLAAGAAYWVSRATVLTVAVAPRDGTEPALIQAYADALAKRHKEIRLKVLALDDVRDSAAALQDGRADLAVVRPDVDLPDNGLTLAILRDQAMIIASPEGSGLTRFPQLDRKRLAILAHRDADQALIKAMVEHYGLTLLDKEPDGPIPPRHVALVEMTEADLAGAFTRKRIDAVVSVIAPTSPTAQRIVGIVQGVSRTGKVAFVDVENADAIIARLPRLQAVTMPAETFGGSPKVPAEDVHTVGASYRLMARTSLSRPVAADVTQHLFEMRSGMANVTPAADYVQAPSYDSTAGATSARLPIHPGAVDFFEREQQGFVERYETWIYLVAFLGGGVGSALAWVGQRLSRLRRERIEEATDRLLEIRQEAQDSADAPRLEQLAREIDDLAGDIAKHALERPTEARTMSAAAIAIDAARSTVKRTTAASQYAAESSDLAGRTTSTEAAAAG